MANIVDYNDIKIHGNYWIETIQPYAFFAEITVEEKRKHKEYGGCDLKVKESGNYIWKRWYNYNYSWRLWDSKPSDSEMQDEKWRTTIHSISWNNTRHWENTHGIGEGWRTIGEIILKKLPMALLHNPDATMPWCIQHAGNGHYFKTRDEAEEYAEKRRKRFK